MAPATFERCLKRLEKSHILNRNRIGRAAVIVYNIDVVKSTLKKKQRASHLKFENITEEVAPERWESIFETIINEDMKETGSSRSLLEPRKLRQAQSLTRSAFSGMWGIVMSRSFELFILQDFVE
jgi:hypothetical protein